MITYAEEYRVFLDVKHIGTIKRTPSGWAYYPKGGGHYRGESFSTVAAVKRSIES